ncbi:MAG: DUF1441 family protein [Pseudomonadota bacterium]
MPTAEDLTGVSERRLANKAQAAEFFGVSVNTIDRWIRRKCPVVQRGSLGKPWVLDLLSIAEWKFTRGSDEADGEDDDQIPPEKLPPADRKAWYESEVKRRAIQELDRELIPVAEVERTVSTAFAAIAADIKSLPDNLERRHGFPVELIEALEQGLFGAMDALADRLANLTIADDEE